MKREKTQEKGLEKLGKWLKNRDPKETEQINQRNTSKQGVEKSLYLNNMAFFGDIWVASGTRVRYTPPASIK